MNDDLLFDFNAESSETVYITREFNAGQSLPAMSSNFRKVNHYINKQKK